MFGQAVGPPGPPPGRVPAAQRGLCAGRGPQRRGKSHPRLTGYALVAVPPPPSPSSRIPTPTHPICPETMRFTPTSGSVRCRLDGSDPDVLSGHDPPRRPGPRARGGAQRPHGRADLPLVRRDTRREMGRTHENPGRRAEPPRAPAAAGHPVLGTTSNTLVRSTQRSSGPAGGDSDGCGLGRGAAGPDRRCTTAAAGALRVIVQDGSIRMSGHAPPPVPIGNGVTGGPESVRHGREAENYFDRLVINCVRYATIS